MMPTYTDCGTLLRNDLGQWIPKDEKNADYRNALNEIACGRAIIVEQAREDAPVAKIDNALLEEIAALEGAAKRPLPRLRSILTGE
jgi:hypothetical protein